MKGTSKVIMGATLAMVVILAMVLGFILVMLAELYCSLLLHCRQLRKTNSNAIPTATTQTTTTANASSPSHTSQPQRHPPPPPFSSIYAQGVLQAPRSFLLPAVTSNDEDIVGLKKLHSVLHQVVQIQTQEPNASPHHVGVLSSSSSSSTPPALFVSKAPQKPSQEHPLQGSTSGTPCSGGGEHLVYISNPIYENDESKTSEANTPFETPDTSPSRLEISGSSGEDDAAQASPCDSHSPSYTPPLTPMKKLLAEAGSVSLRDARSLDTSASDSRSINGPSSLSSASTFPSW